MWTDQNPTIALHTNQQSCAQTFVTLQTAQHVQQHSPQAGGWLRMRLVCCCADSIPYVYTVHTASHKATHRHAVCRHNPYVICCVILTPNAGPATGRLGDLLWVKTTIQSQPKLRNLSCGHMPGRPGQLLKQKLALKDMAMQQHASLQRQPHLINVTGQYQAHWRPATCYQQ